VYVLLSDGSFQKSPLCIRVAELTMAGHRAQHVVKMEGGPIVSVGKQQPLSRVRNRSVYRIN